MNEVTGQQATINYNIAIELPKRDGDPTPLIVNIDATAIPAEARFGLLRDRITELVKNRVNVAEQRVNKQLTLRSAWAAYDTAQASNALQTAVAKPDGDRPTGDAPAPLDRTAKAGEAIADLLAGRITSQRASGEGRKRATVDPLTKAITSVVVDRVFRAAQAAGTTVPVEGKAPRPYAYVDAKKAVGGDGLAYLNAQIDNRVNAAPAAEQTALRSQLEKRRDAEYVTPARIMTGLDAPKGGGKDGLPALF